MTSRIEVSKTSILIVVLVAVISAGVFFWLSAGWTAQFSSWLRIFRWFAVLALATYAISRRSRTAWIFVGLVAGAEFGHDWPLLSAKLQFLATIFLRLVKTIVAPLIFGTLVVGIAGHRDLKKVGRLGIKSLAYFEVVSTIALLLGFAVITLTRAGENVQLPLAATAESIDVPAHAVTQLIIDIFPENIAKSIADGQVLQVVVFSILFGIALACVPEIKRRPMVVLAEGLCETMFKFTDIVMLAAPIGVFGAVAYTVGHLGLGILLTLSKLILTMYFALLVFVLFVLLPIALLLRVRMKDFLQAATEPVAIAFATASSEAALPRAMEHMEAYGVPRDTVAFVLPTGYTFNLDGSSIYQSIALVFIVQVAGLHLTLGQNFMMLLTLAVSSKGTAGVARASLVIVLATATSFHLPTEVLFILFGIDQLMDMGRTAVNVLGNCLACVVIARWERDLPSKSPNSGDGAPSTGIRVSD